MAPEGNRLGTYTVNMRRLSNVGVMLGHRLRRWPNITPTLEKRLM